MNTITKFAVLGLTLAGTCAAQQGYPQGYPQQPYQQFQPGLAGDKHPMRTMFATSLAQVAQSTGSSAIVAMADGLTGALKNWFDNKRARKGTNGALGGGYYAAPPPVTSQTTQTYPGAQPDAGSYPGSQLDAGGYPQTNYPQGGYPANGYPTDYPPGDSSAGGYPNPSYPDPNAGAYPQTSGGAYPQASSGGYPQQPAGTPGTAPQGPAYAGIAYEVHLLQADGNTVPVDPASYVFHTGDQFQVYYRPSLPGRVDVNNINAAGQNTQIDSSVIAAGQLASLGPYQFTDLQGDETLILKLSPCVTPALYAATRNIVKVQGGSQPVSNSLGLGDCSSTATRGLKTKTRDIRKVSVEGGTAFALDPISANEVSSGSMAPRQITLTLHHR